MIITLKKDVPKAEIKKLIHTSENEGLSVTIIQGGNYNVFGLVGDTSKTDERLMKAHPFVEDITRIAAPYKKTNRPFHPTDTVVDVAGIKVGGDEKIIAIGGSCPVEGDTQIMDIAKKVRSVGDDMLRDGAYKPRASPYMFQGMGTEGIKCMVHARETYGLPAVNELMSADKIDEFVGHMDLIQIGTRNMQNFDLSKMIERISKPVPLERGFANTIEGWITAAEYIMSEDNENVIFCERDIRTFETYTQNILDLSVVPIIKEKAHLSIIIDPSHTTGNWRLVESVPLAAIAAGTDGLIIEVHNNPENTWGDGAQSLKPEHFDEVTCKGRKTVKVIGRNI